VKVSNKVFQGHEHYFTVLPQIIKLNEDIFHEYQETLFKLLEAMTDKNNDEQQDAIKAFLSNSLDITTKTDKFKEYAKFTLNIFKKAPEVAKAYVLTASDVLVNHPEQFKNFVSKGLQILKKSENAAEKYFLEYNPNAMQTAVAKIIESTFSEDHDKYLKANYWVKKQIVPRVYTLGGSVQTNAVCILEGLITALEDKTYRFVNSDTKNYFSRRFWKEILIDADRLRNEQKYPVLNKLFKQHNFPDINTYRQYEFGSDFKSNLHIEETPSAIIRRSFKELKEYFTKEKRISAFSMREFLDLKQMYETFDLEEYVYFGYNNKLDDYFTATKDCLSSLGKYAEEAANLLRNFYSLIFSINSTGYDEDFKESIGRAIMNVATIDGKDVLYVAGVSANEKLTLVKGWQNEVYKGIMKTARKNQDKIDGVFFDLNPRNNSRFSHEWARYVVQRIGLQQYKDYTYGEQKLETDTHKTHRREILFELLNPEWKEIQILRDEGLEGEFFLESVMQEPKNKEIGQNIKPDLVYDKGYVIGKYLAIK